MSRGKDKAKHLLEKPEMPNVFNVLDALSNWLSGPEGQLPPRVSKCGQKNTNRGRVDIVRQTADRGVSL